MTNALIKVIPIFLFIILGKFIKKKGWIKEETESQLKSGVINIALPVILFITFKNMTLKPEFFILSLITFVMLAIFYLIGTFINTISKNKNIILPFFVSAFAFGLLGIPLFEGVYGIENLGELSILGIGNEFFIWFIYFNLVKQKLNNKKFDKNTILNLLKSPMIIAIFLGLVFNIFNVDSNIGSNVLYQGLLKTFDYISLMTMPIILIVIGAGINLEIIYVKKALKFVAIRLLIVLGIGYIVKLFVIDAFYDVNTIFDSAYFTYLILPPPFALAILVGQYSSEENTGIINNATVISTLICILAFVGMVLLTS